MVVYLIWLGLLSFVLGCVASEVLPLAWFTPSLLPTVLVEAELAFLLVVWPLLLPKVLSEANPEGGLLRDVRTVALQIAALAIFALPLGLLCAAAADARAGACLAMQAFPAGIAAGVGMLAAAARRTGRDPRRVYYLALLALSAGIPLAEFVLREVASWRGPSLAACSPFYAPIAGGAPAAALVGLFLLSAAVCALWPQPSSSRS